MQIRKRYFPVPYATYVVVLFLGLVAKPIAVHARSPVILVTTISNSDDSLDQEKRIEFSNQLRKALLRAKQKCRVVGERRTLQILSKYGVDEQKCSSQCAATIGEVRNIDFVLWGRVESTVSGLVGELALYSTKNGSLISSKKRERYAWDDLTSALLASLPFLIKPLQGLDGHATRGNVSQIAGDETVDSTFDSPKKSGKSSSRWDEARHKPPLFPPEASGFFGARVSGGFSFLLERAASLKSAFTPLYQLSIDFHYQLFPLFQIAVAADLAQMRGEDSRTSELKPDVCREELCETQIRSRLDTFWMVGIRPTIRMNLEIDFFETFFGVGLGFLHTSTSGKWTKTATTADAEVLKTSQTATYRFEQSATIFYSVLEVAGVFRVLSRRMGIGLLLQYTVPVTASKGTSPDVQVIADSANSQEGDPVLFLPDAEDYRNTLVRNLNSFSLLTVALTLSYVF